MAPILAFLAVTLAACALAAEDASILLGEIGRTSNESLLWGPYRPNLYFGVRPRIPKSLMGGLMWAKVDNFQDVQNDFRHTCEQNEGMKGYGWDEYDVRSGGQQTIHDTGNAIDITTQFVKIPGGSNGGSWGVRIRGVPRDNAPPDLKTAVVFYAHLEGLGSLEVANERDTLGYESDVVLDGESDSLGRYTLTVTAGKGAHPMRTHPSYNGKPLDRTMVYSTIVPDEYLWQTKGLLFKQLKSEIDGYLSQYGEENLPPPWQIYTISNDPGAGNLHFTQKVFEGPFEYDVLFSSESAGSPLTSEVLSEEIAIATKSFKERFLGIFKLRAPYDQNKYQDFARSMFSNLFGGIGYFYGDSLVDRSYAPEYDEDNEGFWEEAAEARARQQQALEGPSELFTTIPSRPFFPRGFLWDEGFHLLPIADWDMDVALDVVKSWFGLMDGDGWIGREQILGQEARSKVPPEFQVQYPHYANPPTLYFILEAFLDRLTNANSTQPLSTEELNLPPSNVRSAHLASSEVALQYLQAIYPLLKRQYHWFRRTQAGDLKSYDRDCFSSREAYRWRGRTVQHILTSGLDDYPRPQPPHPAELHVDLISWMGMMTKSLKRIATFIGDEDDAAEYAIAEHAILRNIDDLHWSSEANTYCDATIDAYEENMLVCHKGYISIFPFLTGLLPPDSPRMGAILDLIGDKDELWSDFGIRSLSKSDEFYGTGENYWRGPIWMNMNYLAVRELLKVARSPGPHAEKAADLYNRLRHNLVETVYKSWKDTGFAWEQYNPETGAGQRTQHFTGWTSLVVKIMAMPKLGGAKGGGHDEL
ncbi:MAG: Processing alpha glucosidase I [Claussenomyces sp. TS43310]|nr:MAG: Processing alpha glucosidase I [Claussenomyces sp. TS43310]